MQTEEVNNVVIEILIISTFIYDKYVMYICRQLLAGRFMTIIRMTHQSKMKIKIQIPRTATTLKYNCFPIYIYDYTKRRNTTGQLVLP